MKRFRLGTLMLIAVIIALMMGLAVQQHRVYRQQAEIDALRAANTHLQKAAYMFEIQAMKAQVEASLARAEFSGKPANANPAQKFKQGR